jgi:hypothetical protein
MSRSSEIDLVVLFLGALAKAVQEIGLAREEIKSLETECGEKVTVDFVVRNEQGDRIGVKQTESGEIHLIAANPSSASSTKTLGQIKQTYARIQVLEEVQRKGYRLAKEEKMADGTVRMVVQRWQ